VRYRAAVRSLVGGVAMNGQYHQTVGQWEEYMHTHHQVYVEIRGVETCLDVTYTLHKGSPGLYSGPPEKCHESYPAWVEIDEIRDANTGANVGEWVSDHQVTCIQQEIEDYLQSKWEADECDHADYLRDARNIEFWERLEQ